MIGRALPELQITESLEMIIKPQGFFSTGQSKLKIIIILKNLNSEGGGGGHLSFPRWVSGISMEV